MKSKKFLALVMSLTIGLSSLLAGCKDKKPSDTDSYKGDKILSITLGAEPETLDAQKITGSPEMTVANMFIEGLTRVGKEEGKYEPGAAKSWKFDQASNTWTFELNKDAKWADGSQVTAKDFFFGWRLAMDNLEPYHGMIASNIVGAQDYADFTKKSFLISKDADFKALVNKANAETDADKKKALKAQVTEKLEKMSAELLAEFKKQKDSLWEKVGAKEVNGNVEVKLAVPCPYFLGLTSFPIYFPVNEKFYNERTQKQDYTLEAVGLNSNGPWLIKEWKHKDYLALEKNPNYWNKANIKIDKINLKIVEDVSTRTNLLKSGEIDAAGIQGDDLRIFQDKATRDQYFLSDMVDLPDYTVFYLEFNHFNNKLTMNENIRKAISLAIDRKGLVEKINVGDMPAQALIPEVFLGLKKPFREETTKELIDARNVEKAKEYLKKGLEELKLDKLPPQDILIETGDAAKRYMEKLQSDLKEVGIDINIVQLSWSEKLKRLKAGDFGICASGWGPDYLDPMTFLDLFETGGGNNYGQFSNADYDKLIQNARVETDVTKRMGYFYDAEKMLLEHMVIAPTRYRIAHWVPKDYVHGVVNRGVNAPIDYYWADVDMNRKLEVSKKK